MDIKTLTSNIKKYFSKKETTAPIGVCPTCWGFNEWDGRHFDVIKDKHVTPGSEKYESFISKIVDKHVETSHIHENKYICTSCNKEI